MPNEQLAEALKTADIVLLPVGGHYTIDAEQAAAIVRASGARIAIPMHYRNNLGGYDVIATVDGFADLMSPPAVPPAAAARRKEDLSEQPRCVILDIV